MQAHAKAQSERKNIEEWRVERESVQREQAEAGEEVQVDAPLSHSFGYEEWKELKGLDDKERAKLVKKKEKERQKSVKLQAGAVKKLEKQKAKEQKEELKASRRASMAKVKHDKLAAKQVQKEWKGREATEDENMAVTKLQARARGRLERQRYDSQKEAVAVADVERYRKTEIEALADVERDRKTEIEAVAEIGGAAAAEVEAVDAKQEKIRENCFTKQ